jgi:hypothetical protein
MQTYTLKTPTAVGDLLHQVPVTSFQISSLGINVESRFVTNGTAILSVALTDPVSGYKTTVVINDAAALAVWNSIESVVETAVFAQLTAGDLLPAGTLAASIPPATA